VSSPLVSSDLLLAQNVPPKAAPGVVQEAPPAPSGTAQPGGSPLTTFLPIIMIAAVFGPMLLMTSRRQKKEAQARAALKKGDRVVTNAGLIGELVELDDRIAKVKLAPGFTAQVVASMVSPYVAEADKARPKELKEAKASADKK